MRSRAFPRRDEAGAVVRWYGTTEDITERKRAEERLRESEERLRATFDRAAVGVAHVGMDGRILWANPGLGAMLGYSVAELGSGPSPT
jgi:PAS domain-containing protein